MDPILFAVLCGMGSGVVGYMVGANLFLKLWTLISRKDQQKLKEVGVVLLVTSSPHTSPPHLLFAPHTPNANK